MLEKNEQELQVPAGNGPGWSIVFRHQGFGEGNGDQIWCCLFRWDIFCKTWKHVRNFQHEFVAGLRTRQVSRDIDIETF